MTTDEELHKKVRNAIFLEALGSWEESCTFEELSADGRQVYEGYATAAMEVYRDELAMLRAQVHEMAAKIETATTTELAKANAELRATVRHATEMEHAGAMAIAALRSVAENQAIIGEQYIMVRDALLAMFEAKPRWEAAP